MTSSCDATPIRRATSATFSGVDVERELRVDGVVRADRRAADRAPAVVVVRVRVDAPPAAVVAVPGRVDLVRERRGDVVGRVGVDAHLDRGGEHERLEGRARLAARLGEQVELVLRSIRDDRGHRADRARPRADRDERGRRIVRLVQRVADRLLRQPLVARDDRRVDLEPAGANRLGAVHLDQLVADVAEEVRLADLAVQTARAKLELATRRAFGSCRGVMTPVSSIAREHLLPPRERASRRGERVVDRRRLRQPGEERGLRERELRRRLREVRLRRRLDPVRLVSVVDLVQVRRQDPLLRPRAVELRRRGRPP